MAMVTRHRGVHHQLVLDVPQAAAFVVGLTRALAQQPYQSRVRWAAVYSARCFLRTQAGLAAKASTRLRTC